MSSVRIIVGDFRSERVEFDGVGFALRTLSGGKEYIRFESVTDIRTLEREKYSTVTDRLTGLAAGGIVGGIAAGAMAGGLTGPAGAVIGAAAGAILAATRKFLTCQVMLQDGRKFVAIGRSETWAAIQNGVHDAPRADRPMMSGLALPPPDAKTLLSKLRGSFKLSRRVK